LFHARWDGVTTVEHFGGVSQHHYGSDFDDVLRGFVFVVLGSLGWERWMKPL
jgi:hypothetical protein